MNNSYQLAIEQIRLIASNASNIRARLKDAAAVDGMAGNIETMAKDVEAYLQANPPKPPTPVFKASL